MCDEIVSSSISLQAYPLTLAFLWDPVIGSAACLPYIGLMKQEGGKSPVGRSPSATAYR